MYYSSSPNIDNESEIENLFNICGYKYERGFWNYINKLGQKEESLITTLKYKNSIVGHYAFLKQKIILNGEVIPICFASQVMIHPEHRGIKNIILLINKAQLKALNNGYKHILGFPNRKIDIIYEKFFSWQLLEKKNLYTKILIEKNFKKQNIKNLIDKIDTINFSYENNDKVVNGFLFNYSELKHKIFDNNKKNKFELLKINEKNEIYIILKYHENEKGDTESQLLFFTKELNEYHLNLIENYLYQKGILRFSNWKYNFLTNDYILDKRFNTLYYKNLAEEKLNFNSFNLSMINCDVYYF